MRRAAYGLVYVVLVGLSSCGKTVDDPTFNGEGQTAGGTAATGSSSSSGSAAESTGAADQGQDGATPPAGSSSDGDPTAAQTDDGVADGAMTDDGPGDDGGAGCGDAMVSPGEQCDGADLQGFDCASLGLSGGTLACDAVTCTFDTSMCMSGGGGTGGQ